MIEKQLQEVELIIFIEDEEDMAESLEDMKVYAKTYELDHVEIVEQRKETLDEERVKYIVTLEISRDSENLGRKYDTEEQKVFGFKDE